MILPGLKSGAPETQWNATKLSPILQSLRYPKGMKERQRRGNPQTLELKQKDCFASLAMTVLLPQ